MFFGLYNAPLTFTTRMNIIFREEIHNFAVVYIDDILVYSKTAEVHSQHLEVVPQKLRDNNHYANGKRSDFSWQGIELLGYMMTRDGIKLDTKKSRQSKSESGHWLKKGLGHSLV